MSTRNLVRAAIASAVLVIATLVSHAASAQDRSLAFQHLHTKETVNVVFRRNGRLVPEGVAALNRILRDWRTGEQTNMDPALLDLVWDTHRRAGSRAPIQIVSGYRSPRTNAALRGRSTSSGVAENSLHTRGKAIDLIFPDVPLSKLRALGLQAERGGVGYYPRSGSPFVHLDTGTVRHWPRMSRQELAQVFPNGETIHKPADGRPMPGYEIAMARHRNGTAGQTQVASVDAGRSGPGLLQRIFGGGRTTGTAPAVEVASAPVAPTPAVASAPSRTGAPVQTAALEVGFDTASGRTPPTREETPDPVLARIPVPTWAPERPSLVAEVPAILVAEASPATSPSPDAGTGRMSAEMASLVALSAERIRSNAFDEILRDQASEAEGDAVGAVVTRRTLAVRPGMFLPIDTLVATQAIRKPDPSTLVSTRSGDVFAKGFDTQEPLPDGGFERSRTAFPQVVRLSTSAPAEKGGRVVRGDRRS